MADKKQPTCEAPDCGRPCHGKQQWCSMHWKRIRRHGTLERLPGGGKPLAAPETCSVEGCSNQTRYKQAVLCDAHYARLRRTGTTGKGQVRPVARPSEPAPPCSLDECDEPRYGRKNYCRKHYQRLTRTGDPTGVRKSGPKSDGSTTATCTRCGQAFKATVKQRKRASEGAEVYCSRDCQKGGATVVLACSGCGVDITRRRSAVGGDARHFCSSECRSAAGKPTTGRWKPCEQCGGSMWVIPARESLARFCSAKCKSDSHRDRVEWTCETCGRVSAAPRSRAEQSRYCSRECSVEARRAKPGDRYTAPNGYVWLYVDDGAGGTRRVSEHRHAWEQLLGFPLPKGVEVHHLSGDRSDNRIEATWRFVHDKPTSGNLQLWDTRQPAGQDHESKMRWAREIMAWDAQLRASDVLSA